MTKTICFAIVTSLAFAKIASADGHKNLKAFPAAANGMERHVIVLPHKERSEENAFKVELIAGKQMMTDGVNQVRLVANVEAKTLKGWGFTYYEVTKFGHAISTRIGVPPNTPKVKKFISGSPLIIPYNHRLPIVIYTPKGSEVRYRIWRAGEKFEVVKKG